MGQSLSNLLIHIIFSTKNREGWIADLFQAELHAYLAKVGRNMGVDVLSVGGVEDHVHILVGLPRTSSVSELVENLKKSSSKWMKSKGKGQAKFAWQRGYGAFSISSSHKKAVVDYIANQKEHHRSTSFQSEYRRTLESCQVDFDERYVWD